MPNLSFIKMQGCGNDYIFLDCRKNTVACPQELARRLSDRHFGIGSDGLVLIESSQIADGKMRMFNADGSEGNMCGNAIRCVGKFLSEENNFKKEIRIETKSGVKHLTISVDGCIIVNMGSVVFTPSLVPCTFPTPTIPLHFCGTEGDYTCVNVGNPHCVVFLPVASFPLQRVAAELAEYFPEGVNVEVAERDGELFRVRVWERGSGETLACGTGACAVVSAAVQLGIAKKNKIYRVALVGGTLKIKYTDSAVFLSGDAVKVFTGDINL